MNTQDIHQAALLKIAAEGDWWSGAKDMAAGAWDKVTGAWDTLNRDVEPQYRDALLGLLGGGLAGGTLGSLTGRGFWGPALAGAGLGGVGGYFRKPLTEYLTTQSGTPPTQGAAEKAKPDPDPGAAGGDKPEIK